MPGFNQLLMPGTVLYGEGALAEVGKQALTYGRKALIVSDPVMDKLGTVAVCEKFLQQSGLPFVKYTGVDTEPTDRHVSEALGLCSREQCDVIVAIGGGSCIDTAKAVAALMTNGGYIGDYVGGNQAFKCKPLPLIAVPTTAGTGSEVTKVTVIIDTVHDVKMMLSRPELLPAVAIVDPALTLSCPPNVTAATGIDALCHAIEAYISQRAQPVTDMYALNAIRLICGNIRSAYSTGDNLKVRGEVALGAMLAGAAFSNASVTLIHGMSRPVGALFHVPHGISNAMLLPAVLEFTLQHAEKRLADIGRTVNPAMSHLSDSQSAAYTVQEIKRLCLDLGIPNLRTWGIDRATFEQSVNKMAHDALASGSPANHPRVPTHEEIVQLYYICFDYDLERK